MATIPFPGSTIRHARKTIAFDGSANNGNLGDEIPAFSTTGVVLVLRDRVVFEVTEDLACTAPTDAELVLTVAGDPGPPIGMWSRLDGTTTNRFYDDDDGNWAPIGRNSNNGWSILGTDIVLLLSETGTGADITDGTIVIDIFYVPITDDGALAGDDIDIEMDDYIAAAVWAAVTRTLTAIDEDSTTLDIDAAVRAALGLASANLDTQLGDLPTNSELATALAAADDAVLTAIGNLNDPDAAAVASAVWSAVTRTLTAGTNIALAKGTGVTGFNDLDAGDVRDAVGMASADLDTQLDALATSIADLPTNSELATALAAADDAVLLAIGDLNDPSASAIATAVWASATRTLSALGFTLGASDLAADTIGASELAESAITEIVNGVLTTVMTESYAADGSVPTLAQAVQEILQVLTESIISGTTWTVRRRDGSTTAVTLTLNSATEPTSVTRSA